MQFNSHFAQRLGHLSHVSCFNMMDHGFRMTGESWCQGHGVLKLSVAIDRIAFAQIATRVSEWVTSMRIVFTMVVFLAGAATYGSDEPANALRPANIEWRIWRIKVVDWKDRKPIEGAVIRLYAPMGMRIASPARVSEWSYDAWGPIPRPVSDNEGFASFEMPKYAVGGAGLTSHEIVGFIFRCDHPEFSTDNYFCGERNPAQPKIVGEADGQAGMYRTRKIRVGAYSTDPGIPLDDLSAVFNFPLSNVRWTKTDEGLFQSAGFYSACSRCWIVHLPGDGPPQFSWPMIMPVHAEGDDPTEMIAKVSAGARVEGQLDAAVPRPVRNGRVFARVCLPGDAMSERPEFSQLAWEDWADIRADGSFEFASLPPMADLELLAYCDGYVSRPVEIEKFLAAATRYGPEPEIREGNSYPQLFRLGRDTMKPVLLMEPASSCILTFVDQVGHPVSGVRVRASLRIGGIGNSEPAYCNYQRTTRASLANPQADIEHFREKTGRFEAISNSSGEATLRDLPLHVAWFHVTSAGWSVAAKSVEQLASPVLASGMSTHITITLQESLETSTAR
ncbi:MAG: hypothetical protein JWP89_2077 [Schlesneria sp.]|nr:hypothetical protein [Schlesneria sp.]